jgi:hypothetical protein
MTSAKVRGYPYKRSHLVALRPNKISEMDPPSLWSPAGTVSDSSSRMADPTINQA